MRARDVLIGIGNRAVPRATDPLAVHDHLVGCARPVALHFYRLHVRRTAPRPAQRLHPPAASVAHASETTRGPGTVRAFLERFTGKHGDAHADEVPEEEAQQPRFRATRVLEAEDRSLLSRFFPSPSGFFFGGLLASSSSSFKGLVRVFVVVLDESWCEKPSEESSASGMTRVAFQIFFSLLFSF